MTGGMKVSLRMRLSARIIRDDQTSEAFHALNEIVIDRGESRMRERPVGISIDGAVFVRPRTLFFVCILLLRWSVHICFQPTVRPRLLVGGGISGRGGGGHVQPH